MNSSTDRRRAGSAYDSILLASTSPSRLGDTVVPSPRLVAVPLGEAPATGPTAEEDGAADDAPGALPPRPIVPPPRDGLGAGAGTQERIPESGGGTGVDARASGARGEGERGGLMAPLIALGICLGVIFLIGRLPPEMLRTAAAEPAEPVRMAAPPPTAGAEASAPVPGDGGAPTTAPGAGPDAGDRGRDGGAAAAEPTGSGQPTGTTGGRNTGGGSGGDDRANTPGRTATATSPAPVPDTGSPSRKGSNDPSGAKAGAGSPNRSAPGHGAAAEKPGPSVPPVPPTRPAAPTEAEHRNGCSTWTVRSRTAGHTVILRGSADGTRQIVADTADTAASSTTVVRVAPGRLTPAEPSPPPPTRAAPSAHRP